MRVDCVSAILHVNITNNYGMLMHESQHLQTVAFGLN